MTVRKKAEISARKEPQQVRSNRLVEDTLQAAVQVLATEGAQRFTMARVAERAGVSVGSLYQYFPNKAALLFRLQSDEWRQTSGMMASILDGLERPPMARLRDLVHAFVRSERDEAEMRGALDDAAPLYRDAPEAKKARAAGQATLHRFLADVLPGTSEPARAIAGELIITTLSTVGKQLSESARGAEDAEALADAMADMFCAYIERLAVG